MGSSDKPRGDPGFRKQPPRDDFVENSSGGPRLHYPPGPGSGICSRRPRQQDRLHPRQAALRPAS